MKTKSVKALKAYAILTEANTPACWTFRNKEWIGFHKSYLKDLVKKENDKSIKQGFPSRYKLLPCTITLGKGRRK